MKSINKITSQTGGNFRPKSLINSISGFTRCTPCRIEITVVHVSFLFLFDLRMAHGDYSMGLDSSLTLFNSFHDGNDNDGTSHYMFLMKLAINTI